MVASKQNVGIVGAGLVGSLLAVFLARRGFPVTVYEKRPDMRRGEAEGGRSINLALSERGWRALRTVGLEKKVRDLSIPMKGRMMHDEAGKLSFQPYGIEGQAIYSVSRSGLNMALMDASEEAGADLLFDVPVEGIDLKTNEVTVRGGDRFRHDILFGADGAFSVVRLSIMLQTDRFEYSQHYLEHGYKELSMPPAQGGGWRLEKHALHIWPRHSFMLIALPNLNGSFTCTLFFPFEGGVSFDKLNTEANVIRFFTEYFPDALEQMPTLAEDFFANPTASLVTVKCAPWTHHERLALIGDAAHAIVPFYGQGMNAGFEDCSVLDALLNDCDWPEALALYQQLRKPNGDAIAELAFRNFIEMRDKVADTEFLERKRLFTALHEAYPKEFVPVYSMVTFSHEDYAEALAQADLQDGFYETLREQDMLGTDPDSLISLWRDGFGSRK